MMVTDALFRTKDQERIWKKYCGFLDLSLTEFMEMQEYWPAPASLSYQVFHPRLFEFPGAEQQYIVLKADALGGTLYYALAGLSSLTMDHGEETVRPKRVRPSFITVAHLLE